MLVDSASKHDNVHIRTQRRGPTAKNEKQVVSPSLLHMCRAEYPPRLQRSTAPADLRRNLACRLSSRPSGTQELQLRPRETLVRRCNWGLKNSCCNSKCSSVGCFDGATSSHCREAGTGACMQQARANVLKTLKSFQGKTCRRFHWLVECMYQVYFFNTRTRRIEALIYRTRYLYLFSFFKAVKMDRSLALPANKNGRAGLLAPLLMGWSGPFPTIWMVRPLARSFPQKVSFRAGSNKVRFLAEPALKLKRADLLFWHVCQTV